MKSMMKRTTLREIRGSFGRYAAILAIVALGVGFFAGLKETKPFMTATAEAYLAEKNLFDLRLLSTLGFEQEDVDAFAAEDEVETAAGSFSVDVLCTGISENEVVLKAHSLTDGVNEITLKAGRMPENEKECVMDSRLLSEDKLGTVITLTDSNEEDTLEMFYSRELTVVGIADASYYMNFERGTTSLGNGRISGFMYLNPEAFDCDYYTEVFIKFWQDYPIYSDDYQDFMEEKTKLWEDICADRVDSRYQSILKEAEDKLADARTELDTQKADAEKELADAEKELNEAQEQIDSARQEIADAKKLMPGGEAMFAAKEAELDEAEKEVEKGRQEYQESKQEFEEKIEDAEAELADAQQEIDDLEVPDSYVLDRNTNVGYVCFESDSDIVAGIADLFPVFFFLVAALVCITTMNRMVEERRTQIGVLKALGYRESTIMGKFLFYAGSAACIGCVLGYAGGTVAFPRVIWAAYGIMYNMPALLYQFDIRLALVCVLVSLLCSMGATWLSCRFELMETAADLMRPKAPKAGKRVFLEKIPFIWKKLKFLQKVSVRNIVRYKKRLFMMVIGISGCTALLVTGFGLKDSITGLAGEQFDGIQILDGSASLKDPVASGKETELTKKLDELAQNYTFAYEESWDLVTDGKVKSINMVILEKPEDISSFINLHRGDEPVAYPGKGEAIINDKIAENYHISVGDTITVRDEDMRDLEVTVSGIFDNYVYNYIYLAPETYTEQLQEEPAYKSVYINYKDEKDIHEAAAELMSLSGVTSVSVNQDGKERLDNMMGSMNYVVLLVIASAAALAFIVLYNLTNINITERIREIATIKVLGFYRKETSSYVFRENMVLTGIGAFFGLFLGYLLHGFVMGRIDVDMVSFDEHIRPVSYLYSIVLTFVFNFLVNRVMSVRLDRINMAESLKSVD